jgi:hypothetical protein
MSETASLFLACPDVVAHDIPDGLMLVNLNTGAAFKLNRVGAAVWKRLDGVADVPAIVADLETHYRVGPETLLRDVGELLRDLEKQGLISAKQVP